MLEEALKYAKAGFAVFPLEVSGKKPLTTNGCKDATKDLGVIKAWWGNTPNANIGIATGSVSGGLFAIDLDIDEDKGINGYETLKQWEQSNGKLPDTCQTITGRGGYHLLFRSDKQIRNRVNILEGIDIRGEGGYIVAPPSMHPNGNRYEWEYGLEDIEIQKADFNVYNLLNYKGKEMGQFQLPVSIPSGERTATLVKLVCSLQSKGLSDETIKAAVQSENQSRCTPPLNERELEKEVFPALRRYEKGTSSYVVLDKGRTREAISDNLQLISMEEVEEKTPEWLIPGYIPRYQITTLAGDGGAGKTTIWCDIAAAVSSGKRSFLERCIPEEFVHTEPGKVLFFSSEDSFEYTLKYRLVKSGANLKNISSISLKDDRFSEIKFNSPFLERLIEYHRPQLVIFDPIQSFVPADIQMGQRNAMRTCLNPLIGLGEKYGATFLVIVHANKQSGVYGRKRIADSADIWDISRSVLMVGDTAEQGIRYISHEKSNYGMTADSVLFSIENGVIQNKGYSSKKDRDFVSENTFVTQQQPQREEAKEFILDFLKDGEKEVAELDAMGKAQSLSTNSMKNAKAELKKDGKIKYRSMGYGSEKKFYISLIPS